MLQPLAHLEGYSPISANGSGAVRSNLAHEARLRLHLIKLASAIWNCSLIAGGRVYLLLLSVELPELLLDLLNGLIIRANVLLTVWAEGQSLTSTQLAQ